MTRDVQGAPQRKQGGKPAVHEEVLPVVAPEEPEDRPRNSVALAPGWVERRFATGLKDINVLLEGIEVAEEEPVLRGEVRREKIEGALHCRPPEREALREDGGGYALGPPLPLPLALPPRLPLPLPFWVV